MLLVPQNFGSGQWATSDSNSPHVSFPKRIGVKEGCCYIADGNTRFAAAGATTFLLSDWVLDCLCQLKPSNCCAMLLSIGQLKRKKL